MNSKNVQSAAPNSAVYGFGLIGAVVYYITNADGVLDLLWGLIKALVWPGILVYELFSSLGV